MNIKRVFGASLACAALVAASLVAHAAGMFSTLPGIGQPSYCASTVTGTGNLGGVTGTGQGTTGAICGQTVPAGPPTFVGTEYVPADIGPLGGNDQTGGAKTVSVSLLQLGQGPIVDLTTVNPTNTIPNNTPWYYIDGAQSAAFTVTMPASAIDGQVQKIICEQTTTGVMTVVANNNQSLKVNPAAACTAGVAFVWRYNAASATWYRG